LRERGKTAKIARNIGSQRGRPWLLPNAAQALVLRFILSNIGAAAMQINEKVDIELFSRGDLIFAYAVRGKAYVPAAVPPQVIVAALMAAKDALDARKFSAWQEDVSSKLDEISAKLDEVLQELRNLRVWIPEALAEETRRMWSTNIDSNRIILDGIIAGLKGKPDKETKELLFSLLKDVQSTTLNLADWRRYGFSHFNEVITGTIAVLATMQLLRRPNGEVEAFIEVMIKYFQSILSVNIDTSIMVARNNSAADVVSRDTELNNLLNRWWTASRFTRTIGHSDYATEVTTYFYIHCAGTPASGISKVQEDSEQDNSRWPWYPHATGDAVVSDINSRLARRQQAVANTDKLTAYVDSCAKILEILKSMSPRPKLAESDEPEAIEEVPES
jgi:hypothetical protein